MKEPTLGQIIKFARRVKKWRYKEKYKKSNNRNSCIHNYIGNVDRVKIEVAKVY